MTTIKIAFEHTQEDVARAERFLEQERKQNPSWNGAEFCIERDDFTEIAGDESYDAAALFYGVQRVLAGEEA